MPARGFLYNPAMLQNVPVARILGFLFLASVVLLAWMTYDGYRTAAGALNVGAHIRFALFGMVIVLFTHTMTLFYFVRAGTRVKKVVGQYSLPPALLGPPRRL